MSEHRSDQELNQQQYGESLQQKLQNSQDLNFESSVKNIKQYAFMNDLQNSYKRPAYQNTISNPQIQKDVYLTNLNQIQTKTNPNFNDQQIFLQDMKDQIQTDQQDEKQHESFQQEEQFQEEELQDEEEQNTNLDNENELYSPNQEYQNEEYKQSQEGELIQDYEEAINDSKDNYEIQGVNQQPSIQEYNDVQKLNQQYQNNEGEQVQKSDLQDMMSEIYNLRANLNSHSHLYQSQQPIQQESSPDKTKAYESFQRKNQNLNSPSQDINSFIQKKNQQQMETPKGNKTWEKLYSDGKRIRENREVQKQQLDAERLNSEMENLTFQPNINQSQLVKQIQFDKNIYDRTNEWKQKSQNKIEQIRMQESNKDIEVCTFKPNIISRVQNSVQFPNNAITQQQATLQTQANGIDTFLRRQTLARQQKLEKQQKQQSDENNKQRQQHYFTIPKEFQLSSRSQKFIDNIDSLKKAYDIINTKKGQKKYSDRISTQERLKNLPYDSIDSTDICQMGFEDAIRHLHDKLLRNNY